MPPKPPLPPLPPGSPGKRLLRRGWERSAKGWRNKNIGQNDWVPLAVAVSIQQEIDNEVDD